MHSLTKEMYKVAPKKKILIVAANKPATIKTLTIILTHEYPF